MAKLSITFFNVVISALLLLTQSGATFAERLGVKDELGSGSSLIQLLLIEAETKTLGVAKNAMELQTEELKCIPCGAACVSSRNCCRNCYCLIKWEIVIPRCVRRKPRTTFDGEKINVIIEDENESLVKELLKAEAALRHGVLEEAMEYLQAKEETSSARRKCTPCGEVCSDWNECCGHCNCALNTCLYLPSKRSIEQYLIS